MKRIFLVGGFLLRILTPGRGCSFLRSFSLNLSAMTGHCFYGSGVSMRVPAPMLIPDRERGSLLQGRRVCVGPVDINRQ